MTDKDWEQFAPLYRYEFDSPDEEGSGNKMKPSFIQKLKEARDLAAVPFIINSGYRSKAHNRKVGGVESSSHLEGWAADIACTNSRHRAKILNAAIQVGFNRIGIANSFIHLDIDPNKPREVFWLY